MKLKTINVWNTSEIENQDINIKLKTLGRVEAEIQKKRRVKMRI